MSELPFPVPEPVQSFWTASPDPLDNYQSSSTLVEECDVLIIGSGYAGTATAYHLFEGTTKKPSVVLLEARQICSGATGRNGGHVKPDSYFNVPKYTRLYGAKVAAEIAKFETSQVLAVKELVEREKLDCDFHLTRGVDVYMDEDFARRTADSYMGLVQEGVVDVRDVAYTGPEDAERVGLPHIHYMFTLASMLNQAGLQISGVKGAKGCFTFTAASLWPKKMIQQLLARLIEAGLQVHAHTPVTKVSSSRDSQGRWTVETPRGSFTAGKIVYCTNAYTSALLPRYKNRIIPVRGICSHLTTSKGRDSPHLPNTYSLRFDSQQYDYLIPRSDGSIVVGGAREAFWQYVSHKTRALTIWVLRAGCEYASFKTPLSYISAFVFSQNSMILVHTYPLSHLCLSPTG